MGERRAGRVARMSAGSGEGLMVGRKGRRVVNRSRGRILSVVGWEEGCG